MSEQRIDGEFYHAIPIDDAKWALILSAENACATYAPDETYASLMVIVLDAQARHHIESAVKGERERVNGLAAKLLGETDFNDFDVCGRKEATGEYVDISSINKGRDTGGRGDTFLEALESAATTQPSSPSSSGTGKEVQPGD